MNLIPRTHQQFPLGAIQNPTIVKNIPADGLEELRIHTQTLGNLMICFDATDEAHVIAAGEAVLLPQRIERVGNTLLIEGQNLREYFLHVQSEKILIEIHVPLQTRVEIQMVAGVVILNGGEGDVNIHGNFGEVTGITKAHNLKVDLRAGDVTLHELHGAADIHLSMGSATLCWTELDGTERINVRCGIGAIDLHLPPGVAPLEEFSALRRNKTVETPQGTHIESHIGFAGLDILDVAVDIVGAVIDAV